MSDTVQVVRTAAAETILRISQKLKNKGWSERTLAEVCQRCKEANYLRRQTAVDTAYYMIAVLTPEQILETLVSFLGDPVPNVRFKVCVVIGDLVGEGKVPLSVCTSVIDSLATACNDT